MRRLLPLALLLCSCATVDVVRLQPGLLQVPEGTEPLAGIRARCVGFYLFTLGIPDCDMDKVVNELLFAEARKLGAERLLDLRFDGTPEGGIWWLTKLFWFRSATASAIAVMLEDGGETKDEGPAPPPMPIPPPP